MQRLVSIYIGLSCLLDSMVLWRVDHFVNNLNKQYINTDVSSVLVQEKTTASGKVFIKDGPITTNVNPYYPVRNIVPRDYGSARRMITDCWVILFIDDIPDHHLTHLPLYMTTARARDRAEVFFSKLILPISKVWSLLDDSRLISSLEMATESDMTRSYTNLQLLELGLVVGSVGYPYGKYHNVKAAQGAFHIVIKRQVTGIDERIDHVYCLISLSYLGAFKVDAIETLLKANTLAQDCDSETQMIALYHLASRYERAGEFKKAQLYYNDLVHRFKVFSEYTAIVKAKKWLLSRAPL